VEGRRRRSGGASAAGSSGSGSSAAEEYELEDVVEVAGVRVGERRADGELVVLFRVRWADGSEDTWEPADNVAEDLRRDYEEKWWAACRGGDKETLEAMLRGGPDVLPFTRDADKRVALHFAAGLGREDLVRMFLEAGSEVNSSDAEGFTPLHMAAGYLYQSIISVLLSYGANPEQEDKTGRSPLALVDTLKENTPARPELMTRRMALENVAKELEEACFEELEPKGVIDARINEQTQELEYLVEWYDGAEPMWVEDRYVAEDVAADYEKGLEYAEALEVKDKRRDKGGFASYLVRWSDGTADTWEPRANVAEALVAAFEETASAAKRRAKAAERAAREAEAGAKLEAKAAAKEQQEQTAAAAAKIKQELREQQQQSAGADATQARLQPVPTEPVSK